MAEVVTGDAGGVEVKAAEVKVDGVAEPFPVAESARHVQFLVTHGVSLAVRGKRRDPTGPPVPHETQKPNLTYPRTVRPTGSASAGHTLEVSDDTVRSSCGRYR